MRPWWSMAIFLWVGAQVGWADERVVESAVGNGQVTFGEFPDARSYRVQWAPAADGPWSDFADDYGKYLDSIPALGSGVVTVSVPVVYRIIAQLPEFALIPAGTFMMGLQPGGRHPVTLTQSYFMQKTEVTNRQMADVMNWALVRNLVYITDPADRYSTVLLNTEGAQRDLLLLYSSSSQISYDGTRLVVEAGKEDHPCVQVSWSGSQAYCNYLSLREGLEQAISFSDWSMDLHATGYRLPTEAEWEYACRAGTTTDYYTGVMTFPDDTPLDPNLDAAGWYLGNAGPGSHPVGLKQRNPWGLYDMHGNVDEWCWNWFAGHITRPATDPVGPDSSIGIGFWKSIRGGSWGTDAEGCRSGSFFDYGNTIGGSAYTGFRPVRSWIP